MIDLTLKNKIWRFNFGDMELSQEKAHRILGYLKLIGEFTPNLCGFWRGASFVFRYGRFPKLLILFFFFIALSFNVMRLSIGSVVVVLVAEKGRVWVCRFFVENTI